MTRFILFAALVLAPALCATVSELRITEVRFPSPGSPTVEVTHIGAGGFTQAADAYFRFGTSSQAILSGTAWTAGEVKQFTVTGLSSTLSDLWLYIDNQFTLSTSIIHGVKYGGSTASGNETVAVAGGIWPGTLVFCPAPGVGQSLAYDGVGFATQDWFVDSTPSLGAFPDNASGPAVATNFAWPGGSQTFETVSVGDTLNSLTGWTFVDTSAVPNTYTVRTVADSGGSGLPSTGSTRWLRVNDPDGANVQNLIHSPTVIAPANPNNYSWTWFVYFEQPIAAGAAQFPRMMIQHLDGAMSDAWGVEFTNTAINLVITAPTGAATPSTTTADGAYFNQWIKLQLSLNFLANTVALSVNNQVPVSQTIAPSGSMNRAQFRWSFRGDGTGNVSRVLVDDIAFSGSTGSPPTISVSSNGVPVAASQIITVPLDTTLSSLNLAITVNDPNGNSTSLDCAISGLTTQGLLAGQFSSTAFAVPYALTPTTGTFNVAGVTNSITLTADDGQGNQRQFSFSIAVPSPAGKSSSKDEGGCTTDSGEGWALVLLVLLGIRIAIASRSRRLS